VGTHNESFDWIVRLEERSFAEAMFEKFPSVLSLRPLGTGLAWILYRLGGHDVGLVEIVNAVLALAAWAWVTHGARHRRLQRCCRCWPAACSSPATSGCSTCMASSMAPAAARAGLVRGASGPLDVRALMVAFVAAAITALAHPYALLLVVAFAIGALLETPALRQRAGWMALLIVLSGAATVYFALVPPDARGQQGSPLPGWMTSFARSRSIAPASGRRAARGVDRVAHVARSRRLDPGARHGGAGRRLRAHGLARAAALVLWAIVKCARHGRWTLAASSSALLCCRFPIPRLADVRMSRCSRWSRRPRSTMPRRKRAWARCPRRRPRVPWPRSSPWPLPRARPAVPIDRASPNRSGGSQRRGSSKCS